MKFNPTNKEESLYEDALYWSGANTASFPVDPDFTRAANWGLDRVTSLIFRADNTYQWHDQNLSTELIDTSLSLTSGTTKYSIDNSWLKIGRVRIKDQNGNWKTLKPVDRREMSDSELDNDGTPTHYDKLGNFLYLYPTPNYSQSNGIEIQFQEAAEHFVVSDTDKEPGFASQFHRLISLYAALDYVESNSIPNRAEMIRARIGRPPNYESGDPGAGMERELSEYYADRDRHQKPHASLQAEDYGRHALGDNYYSRTPKGFDF